MEKNKQVNIYCYSTNEIVFTGAAAECRAWLLGRAFKMPDGRCVYRCWIEGSKYIYDVGEVFYTEECVL